MAVMILYNAVIVTGTRIGAGAVVIENDRIRSVVYDNGSPIINGVGFSELGKGANGNGLAGTVEVRDGKEKIVRTTELNVTEESVMEVDIEGRMILAGGIDEHVHFREPGLTRKADMESESLSALYGGVTSFVDMPNTIPQTTSMEAVEDKAALAEGRANANYGFYIGATNDNYEELMRAVKNDREKFAGIKIFMGSSTGKMKVNDPAVLDKLFSIREKPILVHCEDDDIIGANYEDARRKHGSEIPISMHPQIRSREACINSTKLALELALKHGTRLHILHISTAEEVDLIAEAKERSPLITAETTINYLWFSDKDYERLGGQIKCNPAIKAESDRLRLIEGLRDGVIDTIGTDHAPHLWEEKFGKDYGSMPSGIPCNQHTLPVLLTLADRYGIPMERMASAFSERPAKILGISERGRIEEGQYADLVIVDPKAEWTVTHSELKYKCGWSPYVGETLKGRVEAVVLNGQFIPLIDNKLEVSMKGNPKVSTGKDIISLIDNNIETKKIEGTNPLNTDTNSPVSNYKENICKNIKTAKLIDEMSTDCETETKKHGGRRLRFD